MNILVVDDSTAMRMMVIRTLKGAGFGGHDMSQAKDGAEALEMIRADTPDIVLCDWNMPNMTGIELLNALTEEGLEMKFGFITTEQTSEMRDKAKQAGADFMIAKPFTAEAFQAELEPIFSALA